MDIKAFTDPTPEEALYLIAFDVGTEKIRLYGSPTIMSFRSELMKSLLGKLDVEHVNALAPEMKMNENSLVFLWTQMNRVDIKYPKGDDLIELWPLMNYFDIKTDDDLVGGYFYRISKLTFNELNKHKDILKDILKKVKLLGSSVYEDLSKIVIKAGSRLIIIMPDMMDIETRFNPEYPEIMYEGFKLVENNGNKYYERTCEGWPSGQYVDYFTYPEWDNSRKSYYMYSADDQGNIKFNIFE